jgi:hypothetical protein
MTRDFRFGFPVDWSIHPTPLWVEALILSLDYRDQIFSARELAIAQERLTAARQLYPPPG